MNYEILYIFSDKEATLGPFQSSTISSRFALAATYFELGRIIDVDNLELEKYLAYQVILR